QHLVPALLLSVPRPPRSSLFPSTTLFRSRNHAVRFCTSAVFRSVLALGKGSAAVFFAPAVDFFHVPSHEQSFLILQVSARSKRVDRKSTRLNSSHVKISYAVLCLKKQITT